MLERKKGPWHEGIAAARANALPGVLLIVIAVVIVGSYYVIPPVQTALDAIADVKLRAGFIFAICSTAIFGGLLPVLVQQMRPSTRRAEAWRALPFLMGFWAVKGAEIDLLYRVQAWMFGDNSAISTIVAKVIFDEFVYVPLWAVPTMVIGYAWHENGYDLRRTLRRLGSGWYRKRVVPMMLANWAVWVPTVALIYCLKLPLQLPVQNVVLCLWAIMVMFLAKAAEADATAAEARGGVVL
ncbi:MAG: hypothetical protein WD079_01275 [Phycisphaeraceae bacterium]